HRCRDCATDVHIETGPVAFVVRRREARQPLAHTTGQHASRLDCFEGGLRLRGLLGGCRLQRKTRGGDSEDGSTYAFHGNAFQGHQWIVSSLPFGRSVESGLSILLSSKLGD